MRISIGRRLDPRTARPTKPITAALTVAVCEFAKEHLLPSDVISMTLSPKAFDRLYAEGSHSGEYNGEPPWINIAGIVIHRGT